MRTTNVVGAALVAALCAAGCGKGTERTAQAESGGGKAAADGAGAGGKATAAAKDGKAALPVAPSRGPEHAVFSLIDNRLLAHHQRGGGLVVAGGSAGFAKYLRFGKDRPTWAVREEVGGVKVASMKSKAAGLHLPLTAEQAGATTLRLRAQTSGAQRLGVRINGKQEVTTELADGWSTAEIALPPGALAAGENELLFFAGRSPVSLAWLQVGGAAFGDELGATYDGGAQALVLPDGGGAAWYVTVPDKGLVTANLSDAACKVAVTATPEDGAPVTGELVGKGSAVDLAALGGKVARLELTATGCPSATLAGAALVVPGATPEVKKGPAPKHVVLLVMDSLRADRIRAFYDKARPETPFLDGLLDKAAFFTTFYVQGNETKCSHASLWTSLYPVNHKMIPPNSKIDHAWVTVDEVAKQAGLYTSGNSANGYITPSRGFGQKWDKYRNHIHDGGGLRAEDLHARGWEQLAGKEKEPWLMYMGWIDTHVSWRAKEPWFSKYATGAYGGPFKTEASGQLIEKIATGKMKIGDADIQRVRALYDSNVSYQDEEIRKLFAKLEEQGILDQTMIVMTADHGDELFEVGKVGHGGSSRDSVVWVPGIIYYPPMFPGGKVPEGAESIDLVPTIADALGVEPDPSWQGESLIPLANGVGRGYPRLAMSSKYENGHAARMGGFKVYWSGGARAELYDTTGSDPDEKTDLSAKRPMALRMMADALWTLRLHNKEWKKSAWGNPANHRAGFPAAMGE